MLNVSRESCQEKGSRNRFVEGIYIYTYIERERERVVLTRIVIFLKIVFFEKIFRKRKDNDTFFRRVIFQ